MKKTILLMLIILSFLSCSKEEESPENTLKNFIDASIGNVITREYVLSKVTGQLKQNYANMSDEEFASFSDLRNIKRNSFKILSKSCHENKCFLTYLVGYNSEQFASEVKKIAEISEVDGKWLIEDISNLKTYHESIEAINTLE